MLRFYISRYETTDAFSLVSRLAQSMLNKNTPPHTHQGDRFALETSAGTVVRRAREGDKLTATAMDMVQERVNKSTRDTEAVIFVQDERDRSVRKRSGGCFVRHSHQKG